MTHEGRRRAHGRRAHGQCRLFISHLQVTGEGGLAGRGCTMVPIRRPGDRQSRHPAGSCRLRWSEPRAVPSRVFSGPKCTPVPRRERIAHSRTTRGHLAVSETFLFVIRWGEATDAPAPPPQKGLGTLPVTPALPEPRMQRLGPCAPGNRQTPRWGFTNFISRLCTFVFCVLPEACQVRVRAAKCCCARPKAPTRVPARPPGPRRGAGPGTGSAATPGPPPASQHSVHPPPGQTVPSWARFGSDDDAAASGVEVSGSGVGGPGAHGRPRCGLRGRGGGGRSFWFGSVLGDSGTQHH